MADGMLLLAAQWMRRMAMPQFEPTRQQSWLATHPR